MRDILRHTASRPGCFEEPHILILSVSWRGLAKSHNLISPISCKMFPFIPHRGIVKINELMSALNVMKCYLHGLFNY